MPSALAISLARMTSSRSDLVALPMARVIAFQNNYSRKQRLVSRLQPEARGATPGLISHHVNASHLHKLDIIERLEQVCAVILDDAT
jgi:hypothetical protein